MCVERWSAPSKRGHSEFPPRPIPLRRPGPASRRCPPSRKPRLGGLRSQRGMAAGTGRQWAAEKRAEGRENKRGLKTEMQQR